MIIEIIEKCDQPFLINHFIFKWIPTLLTTLISLRAMMTILVKFHQVYMPQKHQTLLWQFAHRSS